MRKLVVIVAVVVIILLVLLYVGLSQPGVFPGDGTFSNGNQAGFLWGYVHGLVIWLSLIVRVISPESYSGGVYELCNSGIWYDVGFILGASSSLGGSISASRSRRSRH